MGVLAHMIGIFPQSVGNIPLFRLDFDIDSLGLGNFCKHEFEDAIFQDSRRFGRIDFGGQPQLAAELATFQSERQRESAAQWLLNKPAGYSLNWRKR
jgi:hypothetical protein